MGTASSKEKQLQREQRNNQNQSAVTINSPSTPDLNANNAMPNHVKKQKLLKKGFMNFGKKRSIEDNTSQDCLSNEKPSNIRAKRITGSNEEVKKTIDAAAKPTQALATPSPSTNNDRSNEDRVKTPNTHTPSSNKNSQREKKDDKQLPNNKEMKSPKKRLPKVTKLEITEFVKIKKARPAKSKKRNNADANVSIERMMKKPDPDSQLKTIPDDEEKTPSMFKKVEDEAKKSNSNHSNKAKNKDEAKNNTQKKEEQPDPDCQLKTADEHEGFMESKKVYSDYITNPAYYRNQQKPTLANQLKSSPKQKES